jgi:chorismate synthase
MQIEKDELEVLGGVRFGKTLGSPVAILIRNTEWPNWEAQMSVEGEESGRKLTAPRPGHADLSGMLKYDTHDARDILERSSARETAARTVVGYLAKLLLRQAGIEIISHVVAIGDVVAPGDTLPTPADLAAIDESPVRVFDEAAGVEMEKRIEQAQKDRDTLGGVVEVLAYDVPTGLGSHVHWDRKLDARLGEALMSIHAIKGVEVGDAFDVAARPGSESHDEIFHEEGAFSRRTNHAGGTEGGISIGGILRVRAAMKPISTLMRPLQTVDVNTKEADKAFRERSDVCAVPAAGVVAEQMVAIVLAQEMQRKFGGDTVDDFLAALDLYRRRLSEF